MAVAEHILDDLEATTGGRVIQGACKIGGVRRDIESKKLDEMVTGLKDLGTEIRELNNVFFNDSSVRHRTKGIGIIPEKEAYELGAVGPTGRGSGIAEDARMLGYAAYDKIDFEPVVETSGDCYARCVVRGKESADID